MALVGAVSNLSFTWIDGVSSDQLSASDRIVSGNRKGHYAGAIGSWKSHMKALEAIVEANLESALVMEDDVDWDVRLKSQLQTFASASKTWLRESRSYRRSGEEDLLDFVPPSPFGKRGGTTTDFEDSDSSNTIPLSTTKAGLDSNTKSVYGDGWDVLWLGHCGADLSYKSSHVSPLKVAIFGDETVPAPKHLKPHPFALLDKLGEVHPPHTRVVHASSGNVCSLAYAVSQAGARKLLRRFNANFETQWDLVLQRWCEGGYVTEEGDPQAGPGEVAPVCLTVQPPLISHHYSKDGASNIQAQGGGFAKGTGTPYIRISTRENLQRLVAGVPREQLVDQLPDDGKTIWR